MTEVANKFLIPHFIELGMNATGEWVQSIEVASTHNSGTIRGRDYTEYLQRGRSPNADQSTDAKRKWAFGMANNNPQFKAWLNARGLTEYGVQIAYTIADEGTSWYKQGGSDLLDVLDSQECIDFVNERIGNIILIQAQSEIETFVNEF